MHDSLPPATSKYTGLICSSLWGLLELVKDGTIISACPVLIQWYASPIAWAPAAHAALLQRLGP